LEGGLCRRLAKNGMHPTTVRNGKNANLLRIVIHRERDHCTAGGWNGA